jgi:hypothetical protein
MSIKVKIKRDFNIYNKRIKCLVIKLREINMMRKLGLIKIRRSQRKKKFISKHLVMGKKRKEVQKLVNLINQRTLCNMKQRESK